MVEELDPEKYHIITPKKKRTIIASLVFVFLFLIPSLLFVYYKIAVWRPSQTDKEITIEIGSGDSALEVASQLYSRGAINSEFLFIFYVFLNRAETNIQAGTYVIKAGTPMVTVIEQLQHGTNDVTLTFVEGWRVEEFARLAAKKLTKINYKTFLDAASGAEGYLFPDTYFVNREIQDADLVKLLRDTFDQKTATVLTSANLTKAGLTKEQTVIFASMVEREVAGAADRPIVAGILIKRWKEGMKLDVDATTQYSVALARLCKGDGYCIPTLEQFVELNWWPKDLTTEELKYDSPFNTRAKAGLPPTPISSVSLSSLEAVISYQTTPYYFYLTDKGGVTHYAKTLVEHNANVKTYLSEQSH